MHIRRQMGKIGKQLDVNFIISTGDNFYDSGLEDVHDKLFTKSFSDIYQAPSLQRMWYAVLGNHDYRGNPEAQVDKYLTSRDSRWFCDYTWSLRVDLGRFCNDMSSSVEFFFIDTNPFEEDYWTPNSEHYKWTRKTPRNLVLANQLKNLTEALEASTATWKLVVGHHTMFSYGPHGNTPELVEKILPILKANKVDMYINGHDHTLQHIKRADSDIHFVTSGGGSKAWKGEFDAFRPDAQLFYDGQGFTSISVTPTALLVNYYDITGTIIHQIELKK
jgi:tartrate-resistant acid phosphatase type 5